MVFGCDKIGLLAQSGSERFDRSVSMVVGVFSNSRLRLLIVGVRISVTLNRLIGSCWIFSSNTLFGEGVGCFTRRIGDGCSSCGDGKINFSQRLIGSSAGGGTGVYADEGLDAIGVDDNCGSIAGGMDTDVIVISGIGLYGLIGVISIGDAAATNGIVDIVVDTPLVAINSLAVGMVLTVTDMDE